jgi:hypothetical protein
MPAADSDHCPRPDTKTEGTQAGPPGLAHLVGAEVPGFEIAEEIGRGGVGVVGVVYKARQSGLNRPAALKMLIAGPFADPSLRARFLVEAESVAALEGAVIDCGVYTCSEARM